MAHVWRLMKAGVAPSDIGVITPYNAQVRTPALSSTSGAHRPERKTEKEGWPRCAQARSPAARVLSSVLASAWSPQVALLRELRPERLHAVEISSVDGFQVSQADGGLTGCARPKLQGGGDTTLLRSLGALGPQGREKEAIIISMVRSNAKGEVGFLSDQRRMNVAVTRARRHVVLVADTETVSHDPFLARLIKYFEAHGEYCSAQELVDELRGAEQS